MNKKTYLAILLSSAATSVSAVDLGEFNGTQFDLGGYVKVEGVHNMPDVGDNQFSGSARQSRFNLTAQGEENGHKLKGFIEADFWDNVNDGSDSTFGLRLRHAFISVDNLTFGQTWNGQFFATAPLDVRIINFWGPGAGTIAGNGAVVRPELVVHYAKNGLRLTLQDPIYDDAAYPDMIGSYTLRTDGGHAFSLAVTGREVGTLNGDSELGAAVSLASKFSLGQTALSLTAYTGEGQAVYAGWGFNGSRGASTSDVNSAGEPITTTGLSAGVTHQFTSKLRGTLRYGQVKAEEVDASVSDDTFKMATANLIYSYTPSLDFGIELRDQNAATLPSAANFASSSVRDEGRQVEIMAMYKF